MDYQHISVLLDECLEQLRIRPNGTYFDGTLGGGGHAKEVLKKLSAEGTFVGIDQDETAINLAEKQLKIVSLAKLYLYHCNFVEFEHCLEKAGVGQLDGILLDLGVSSHQLDTIERGFSYMREAPLDMRMDRRQTLTAADIVNRYQLTELTNIIRDYGEEKFASRIARQIVDYRQTKSIETTMELVDLIDQAIPKKIRQARKGHPAKKTFQAIRIECNSELQVVSNSLVKMIDRLADGGRLCVITFHSLEDRLVKRCFAEQADPCICPRDFPVCACGKQSKGRVMTKKPILPTEKELLANRRSQSAKLRVFEKRGT